MAKEARIVHLQRDLSRLEMPNALRALNWMIETMNANNGFARKDGSHYYYHLVDSTQDLINHGVRDEVTITGCILHDAAEDIDGVSYWTLRNDFGFEVAGVVDLVTKDKSVDYKQGYNLKSYLAVALSDVRSCLIKTADRKHNFSTLDATGDAHEYRQAIETEQYFLPFFKEARKKYPEYSSYFHSAKTTIVPHLNKIKKYHRDIESKNKEIEEQRKELEMLRGENNSK